MDAQDKVELTELDIPGAALNEPFDAHNVAALRWWLQCRGIRAKSSWRKKQLVSEVIKAASEGLKVIDVDGSYLPRKYERLRQAGLNVAPLDPPSVPPAGWEDVNEDNHKDMAEKIPVVLPGLLYSYLAEGVGHSAGKGAFRALSRGYVHWASGRMEKLEVNCCNRNFTHVRCTMKPSMKDGSYSVYVLLETTTDHATNIRRATCQCAAGQSASCTHVSALLHALVALTPIQFTAPSSSDPLVDAEESTDSLPITSYPCVWKAPKKRKQSNLKMADADFEKHVYGRTASAKKRRRLEDFDPRPLKYRGKANDQLTSFLEHVRGKGLGISLLKDESTRYWSSDRMTTSTHDLPSNLELKRSVEEFMKCLSVNEDKAREIERTTRQQRNSIEWFTVRRFRITSSTFGEIYHRRPETPPTALVVRLLQQRQVVSPAIQWGVQQEAVALQAYVDYQHDNGHTGLTVCGVGFHVSISHPFLGASPDGGVYDPSCTGEPYGFLEIKCPYSHRNSTPEEACESSTFCCSLETVGDTKEIRLRTSHKYYCQVQGQMGVGSRPWCDFVVYTKKSISVQRIRFDSKFWNDHLVPKLEEFYTKCLAPEIVSPVHTLGLPVRDLRKQ